MLTCFFIGKRHLSIGGRNIRSTCALGYTAARARRDDFIFYSYTDYDNCMRPVCRRLLQRQVGFTQLDKLEPVTHCTRPFYLTAGFRLLVTDVLFKLE